jgi:hypothetical protein
MTKYAFRELHVYMNLELTVDRSNPKFEPIGKDEKNKERKYYCVGCGGSATQTAFFKIQGATIVERYCDSCAKKLK